MKKNINGYMFILVSVLLTIMSLSAGMLLQWDFQLRTIIVLLIMGAGFLLTGLFVKDDLHLNIVILIIGIGLIVWGMFTLGQRFGIFPVFGWLSISG